MPDSDRNMAVSLYESIPNYELEAFVKYLRKQWCKVESDANFAASFQKAVNYWGSKDTFERFEIVNDIIIKRLEKDKELYHPLRKIVSDVISTIEVCEMITAHVAGEMKYRPPAAETENAVNLYFEDCFKAHSSKFTKHKRPDAIAKEKKSLFAKNAITIGTTSCSMQKKNLGFKKISN